jgi:hypothetical protein
MYQVESHLLCLSCYTQLQQVEAARQRSHNEKIAYLMAEQNYLSDQMAAMVGLPPSGARYHIPQPINAYINQAPMNYINIDRSVIGMLNTGSIQDVQSININVKSLLESGSAELARALKVLTEAVASSQELADTQRTELLDQLNLVSGEAALTAEGRKPGVIKPVLSALATGLNTVGSLAKIWAVTGDLICAHFGLSNPFNPSH